MRTGIVAFLIGNISFLYWPVKFSWAFETVFSNKQLVNITFCFCLLLILILILYKAQLFFVSSSTIIFSNILSKRSVTYLTFSLFLLLGWSSTAFYVEQIYPVLELEKIEGKTIEVKGYLSSIPKKSEKKQSFDFVITARQLVLDESSVQWDKSFQGKVRLNWYHFYKNLESGQQWQLKIRLKKPNGLLNGGFDYEKWLYQNRILATGYIREGFQINTLSQSFFQKYLLQFRQSAAKKIDTALLNYPYKGLVKALAIGVRDEISAEQWQMFLRTGTNHLIAISGLHIGLMSSFIWMLVYFLWRSVSFLNLKYPAVFIASIAALVTAIIYAALAGFAIPTQRALIMLSVAFTAMMLKREFLPFDVLLIALFAVILFDPLSSLSIGFWLSFWAVAIILLTVSARLGTKSDVKHKLWKFIWLQWAIFIGLLSPLMVLFHQFSIISPIANLFAVPLMSLIIVPLTLIAVSLLFLFEPLAMLIFQGLEWPVSSLFITLETFSRWSNSLIYLSEPPWFVVVMVFVGSLWLLMPKGWPGRSLGILLILPAFFIEAEKIPQGQIHLTMLDVGQGLAMILRTQNHSLIYDTGDKYSEQFNMADQVIIPYMKQQGMNKVDKLIVSHSDRDHAGSFSELIQQIEIDEILAGEPQPLNVKLASNFNKKQTKQLFDAFTVNQCLSGQKWQWDHVQFQILSPKMPLNDKKNNNRSCVLYITTATNRTILLAGDIEKKSEKQILIDFPELTADILQVPHHGSRTSSSSGFLKQIQPEAALFSFGYRNRFQHPSDAVIRRYKKMQVKIYNTGNGAIDIKSNMTNNSFSIKEYRVENKRIWHREIKLL